MECEKEYVVMINLKSYIGNNEDIDDLKTFKEKLFSEWRKRRVPEKRETFAELIKHIEMRINRLIEVKPNGLKKPVVVPKNRGKLRTACSGR